MADESSLPRRIKPLDPQLVNRIAAGEIIQRPFNALKELMENCLDAGSTSIHIVIKEGGLKLIQITDNGCGIAKEDLKLICERFTTSKMEKFEDLNSINTFGFRGEALASISHVSRLTIMSRVANSPCAFKASYTDGLLTKEGIQPCAMSSKGTQITVEDLFYNCPLRRNALKTSSEEFSKIYDVVSRYAVHNYHVCFYLKRTNESCVDLKTNGCSTVGSTNAKEKAVRCVENENYLIETISSIFANCLKGQCETLRIEPDEKYKFQMSAYTASAKYSVFILFINERLVDCQPLKKTLQNVFAQYLPKNEQLFVYINLRLDPNNLDVNVHPTKHEVRFLYQDEIIAKIQQTFEEKFIVTSSTRTYYVKNLTLDSYVTSTGIESLSTKKSSQNDLDPNDLDSSKKSQPNLLPYQLTRVDSRERKLDSYFHSTSLEKTVRDINEETKKTNASAASDASVIKSTLRNQNLERNFNYESLAELREKVEKDVCKEMRLLLADMSFVGCIERELALIQYKTSLFIFNTRVLSEELFYQICLFNFGNFGYFKLEQPIRLTDVLLLALEDPEAEWTPDDGPKEKIARRCARFLNSKSTLLEDYYSIKIKCQIRPEDNEKEYFLEALPMLIEDYEPDLDELPIFLLKLVITVDWEQEKDCFNDVCSLLASFYAMKNVEHRNKNDDNEQKEDDDMNETSQSSQSKKPNDCWIIEHVLYKAFKNFLLPSKQNQKQMIFKLVDLSTLYRVFERC